MQTPAKIINNLRNELTEQSEQPMKESLNDIELSTWSNWLKLELPKDDKEIVKMIERTALFVRAFKQGVVHGISRQAPRWLTLMGETGVGKTHCATKAWEYLKNHVSWAKTEYPGVKIYWPKFVSELRSGESFERLRDMMDWPVLFLDDIGAERDTTGFSSEQLNMILGCRERKWTIITSNLKLKDIGGIDPRMADRIIRSPNLFAEINTISYSERI